MLARGSPDQSAILIRCDMAPICLRACWGIEISKTAPAPGPCRRRVVEALTRPSSGALQVMRQDPPEPFLGSKGRKEHGQDRLAGSRGNVDVTSGAETVGNELDQLLEHVQGMKMGLIKTAEFFAVLIGSRVFPVDKAEEVPHRSDPFGSRWEPIYRTGL